MAARRLVERSMRQYNPIEVGPIDVGPIEVREPVERDGAPRARRPRAQKTRRGRGTPPGQFTVWLGPDGAKGLDAMAAKAGLTRNAWAAALIRRRLHNRPTFAREDETALLAAHVELRRIAMILNQMARAMGVSEAAAGGVVDIAALADFRIEIRAHMAALHQAIAGNLDFWKTDL